jgi:hypothetical protein
MTMKPIDRLQLQTAINATVNAGCLEGLKLPFEARSAAARAITAAGSLPATIRREDLVDALAGAFLAFKIEEAPSVPMRKAG